MSDTDPEHSETKIPVAISSCLLGHEVRYDGGHKHNGYITQSLSAYFDYLPFCPEAAVGMGIPREPIRLVDTAAGVRALGVKHPELDPTDDLRRYARQIATQLGHVCGYIFKKGSPSCGMERVKVYGENGHPRSQDSGIYAKVIMEQLPALPVEEEGRLMDPVLRENFIERVFVYYAWQQLVADGLEAGRLVEFHTRHKFALLAHDEVGYRELGRLVADAGKEDIEDLSRRYLQQLMSVLKKRATRKRHTNVLQHILGYFKEALASEDKQELLDVIDQYRLGLVPLVVPITLLKHHLRRHPHPYIENQTYLSPHPMELMLRNQI